MSAGNSTWPLVAFILLAGCTTVRVASSIVGADPLPCGTPDGQGERPLQRSVPEMSAADEAILARHYSGRSVAVARLIGAAPNLVKLEGLRDRGAPSSEQQPVKERLLAMVFVAELGVQQTQTELACDRQRVDRTLLAVRSTTSQRNQVLTATSLGVAAAAAIIGGALIPVNGTERTQAAVGVTGGVTVGALGAAQLWASTKAELLHPRNALADVWLDPHLPAVLSPEVQAFIDSPPPGDQGTSQRVVLVQRWERAWFPPSRDCQELLHLYFGSGGIYTEDQLMVREHMLGELLVVIARMSAALRSFVTEVGH